MNAYGYIEVVGLVPAVEAADAALKAAEVQVAVIIKGEIGAVRTAVNAAEEAVNRIGKVVNTNIIAKPDASLENLY